MNMGEIENLTNYHNSFINSTDGWTFFVGLKDYVNYITGTPELNRHVIPLNREAEVLKNKEEDLEKQSIQELLISKEELVKILKKNNFFDVKEISEHLQEFDQYLNGGMSRGRYLSGNLAGLLFKICIEIPESNRRILLKKFEDSNPEFNNIHGNFIFSKTLSDRRALTGEIEHKQSLEIWGDWKRLSLVPRFIEATRIDKIPLEDGDVNFGHNLISARFEYDNAKDGRKFSEIIPEYKSSIAKIQAYLIRKVSESDSEKEVRPNKPTKELSKIKTITIVSGNKREGNRIAVNKNYIESFEITKGTSKNIQSLMNAILDGTDELKDIADLGDCKDYLNSNQNCRIYKDSSGKKQLYAITPIVKFKNSFTSNKELEILPVIKTEVITFSKYSRLLTEQKNRDKTQKT